MTMQRRHFELIAEGLSRAMPTQPQDGDAIDKALWVQWRYGCRIICLVLAQTNPNFNRERFLKACGVEG